MGKQTVPNFGTGKSSVDKMLGELSRIRENTDIFLNKQEKRDIKDRREAKISTTGMLTAGVKERVAILGKEAGASAPMMSKMFGNVTTVFSKELKSLSSVNREIIDSFDDGSSDIVKSINRLTKATVAVKDKVHERHIQLKKALNKEFKSLKNVLGTSEASRKKEAKATAKLRKKEMANLTDPNLFKPSKLSQNQMDKMARDLAATTERLRNIDNDTTKLHEDNKEDQRETKKHRSWLKRIFGVYILKTIFTKLLTLAGALLMPVYKPLMVGLKTLVTTSLKTGILGVFKSKGVFSGIKDAFTNIFKKPKDGLGTLWKTMRGFGKGIAKTSTIIGKVLSTPLALLSSFAGAITGFFKAEDILGLKGGTATLSDKLKGAVAGALGALASYLDFFFMDMIGNILNFFGMKKMGKVISELFDGISAESVGKFMTLNTVFADLTYWLTEKLPASLWKMFYAMEDGLTNLISIIPGVEKKEKTKREIVERAITTRDVGVSRGTKHAYEGLVESMQKSQTALIAQAESEKWDVKQYDEAAARAMEKAVGVAQSRLGLTFNTKQAEQIAGMFKTKAGAEILRGEGIKADREKVLEMVRKENALSPVSKGLLGDTVLGLEKKIKSITAKGIPAGLKAQTERVDIEQQLRGVPKERMPQGIVEQGLDKEKAVGDKRESTVVVPATGTRTTDVAPDIVSNVAPNSLSNNDAILLWRAHAQLA